MAPLDEEFCITQTLCDNSLARLQPLPSHPPNFVPGVCFTHKHTDNLDLNPTNWLLPDEVKLFCWIVNKHEISFAWIPTNHSHLNKQYFPPIKIPTILHIP